VFEVSGKTLMVVDCRNASALSALKETLEQFSHRIRSVVYSGEDDRRDEDLVAQGRLLGAIFQRVVLCEIDDESQRRLNRVTRLLRSGIDESSRSVSVEEVRDWSLAVDLAWRKLMPGELLVVQSSTIPQTVRKIQSLLGLELGDVPRLASA
jgi:cyanophycin synthetase